MCVFYITHIAMSTLLLLLFSTTPLHYTLQLRKRMLEALRDCPEESSKLTPAELVCHYAAINITWATSLLLTRYISRYLTHTLGLSGSAAVGLVVLVSVLITVALYVYYVYIVSMGGSASASASASASESSGKKTASSSKAKAE
jgi:hypothetical protein